MTSLLSNFVERLTFYDTVMIKFEGRMLRKSFNALKIKKKGFKISEPKVEDIYSIVDEFKKVSFFLIMEFSLMFFRSFLMLGVVM